MQDVVKRPRRSVNAAPCTGNPTTSRLFYVTDRATGMRFLVDSGAELSVIPPRVIHSPSRKVSGSLQAANGSAIPTYGQRSLTLDIGLRRRFSWVFTIASVSHQSVQISSIISAYWWTFVASDF